MNKKLLIFLGFICLFANSCRVFPFEISPRASEFPLVLTDSIEIEKIQRIALSDEWVAVQTPGEITAIDMKTKNTLWKLQSTVPDIDSEFEIVDNNLIFASQNVIVILTKSGERIPLALYSGRHQVIQLIAIYHNYIYVIRGGDWTLEVYDISGNTMLWERWVGRGNTNVFYTDRGNVVIVVTPRNIAAINNSTGELIWEYEREILQSTINGDTLYFLEQESNTYKISAINIKTRHESWSKSIPLDTNERIYQMTILDNLLVLSTRKRLMAVDQDSGKVIWQSNADDIFYTHPILISNTIYSRGASDIIYAIDSISGNIQGYLDLSKDRTPPAYQDVTQIYKTIDGIVLNTYSKILIFKTR